MHRRSPWPIDRSPLGGCGRARGAGVGRCGSPARTTTVSDRRRRRASATTTATRSGRHDGGTASTRARPPDPTQPTTRTATAPAFTKRSFRHTPKGSPGARHRQSARLHPERHLRLPPEPDPARAGRHRHRTPATGMPSRRSSSSTAATSAPTPAGRARRSASSPRATPKSRSPTGCTAPTIRSAARAAARRTCASS